MQSCRVILVKGHTIVVSIDDYEYLSEFKWGMNNCGSRSGRQPKWYAYRLEKKKRIYMHRQIMGDPAGMVVDHINGDSLDNRRENLRVITHYENLKPTFFRKAEPFL